MEIEVSVHVRKCAHVNEYANACIRRVTHHLHPLHSRALQNLAKKFRT